VEAQRLFELLAQGLSNKSTARQLDVTEGTVKSHLATIFDVFNVHNRVSAVAEARRLTEDGKTRRMLDR
jgi:two-component system nitrate/nitrite response regulator NarL